MDLSIITVNTNDKEKILGQLKSVPAAAVGLVWEEIISDNGSRDGSVEEIKNNYPTVKIVANGANIGFGAANNNAYKISQGRYLLFLNPDMRLYPNSLKKMVDWMEVHPKVGIASCKLVDEKGDFNESAKPRRLPGILDQMAIVFKLPHLFPGLIKKYLYDGFDHGREQKVDSVRGSFMMMRRELVEKLGWAFDPRYFIWFEDVDICREAVRCGYEVWYTPVITCLDYVGQNFKRLPGGLKQRWFTTSMVKYFKKWEPWYKWLVIAAARPVGIFLADLNTFFKK